MSSVLFYKVKARELITNRIQSREPLTCFEQLWIRQLTNKLTFDWGAGLLQGSSMEEWGTIILQISPERTTSVFFPAINHSPTRLTFNHLPVPLVEAFGDISTSKSHFTNERIDVWRNSTLFLPTQPTKMAAIFQNWRGLGSVRIGCTASPGPGLTLHPRQRGTGSEVRVIWGLLTGFALKVVHFWLSSLLNRPSRAIRIFQMKQDWYYASILGLSVCIVVRIISTKNCSRKARHDLPHPACMFVCDTSG